MHTENMLFRWQAFLPSSYLSTFLDIDDITQRINSPQLSLFVFGYCKLDSGRPRSRAKPVQGSHPKLVYLYHQHVHSVEWVNMLSATS